MTITHRVAGRIAAWTAVATLGLGAIAGVAVATSTSPSPSANPAAGSESLVTGDNADQGRHPSRLRALARRTVHGEFVVKGKDGRYVTTDTQRGAVTAVSASSITVRSADGFTAVYQVNADTRVRKNSAKTTIAAVKVGDQVFVVAVKEAGGKTARGVAVGKR